MDVKSVLWDHAEAHNGTCFRAEIFAFFIYTGFIALKFRVEFALRSTGNQKVAVILRQARTLNCRTNCIIATGRWIARII